jgi:hypothetical protein
MAVAGRSRQSASLTGLVLLGGYDEAIRLTKTFLNVPVEQL